MRDHLVVAYRSGRRNVALRLLVDCVGAGARPYPGENDAVDEILTRLGLTRRRRPRPRRRSRSEPAGWSRSRGRSRPNRRVVLLDEPSSGLDATETNALVDVFRQLRDERGISLVLVEHNVEMVLGLADRVTVLDFGRSIAEGTPAEIRRSAAVQAAYLGTLS